MSLWQGLLSEGVVVRLGWTLVHFLWQAMAVALLLAMLLRLLRRATANLRYVVACGTLLLMVAMPLVTMQFIDVPGPVAEAGPLPEIVTPETTPTPVVMQTVGALPPLPAVPPIEAADLIVPVPWRERLATTLEPALPYVVLGWLVGVFGLSAWHLGGWAQLQRLRRRMVRDAGDALHTTLDELAARLGVHRAVNLLESALVEVPTVVGWLSPTILLPASALTGLSPDQLRAILAHELAHIRRHDYLANIVQTVVEILGFYHPAVWWVSHRIRIERENCCDDLAVRVCDNSLQYARALASMEEIRHSRSELAMAASGGSLMARIARLLGRPVVDDRRFTWLPGLIALLLVVCVVIPAAFALTRDAPHLPESQADAAPTPATESQDAADPNESPQTQIQVTLVLAELHADTVLDPQTAEDVAGLLVRVGASLAPPTVEELRQPLADVLATFTPAPSRGKEFVDLLRRQKDCVARTLSVPRVTVLSGEAMSFTTGDIATPERPLPEDSEFTFVCCIMTATHVLDQNAVRIDIDMFRGYPVNKPSDPNGQTGTWTLKSTLLAANNEWMTTADNLLRRRDSSGRECIQLPLILATIISESEAINADTTTGAVPTMASADGATHLPPGMGAFRRATSPDLVAAVESGTVLEDEPARTQVLLAFTVLDVVADRALDADTAAQVRPCLARTRLADGGAVPASATAAPLMEELLLPLRDVFARFAPIPEKSKDLTDLLISRGYATILSKPMILTFADEPASISLGEPDDPNTANGYIRLTANARVLDDRDATRLEINYIDRRAMDNSNDPNRPMSSTQIASTLVVPNNEYTAILGMSTGAPGATMRILLIGPTRVIRPQRTVRQDLNASEQTTVKTLVQDNAEHRAQTQVLIEFIVAKALTESVPDRETLSQIAAILAVERPQVANELAREKEMTLGEVLRRYVTRQSLSQETGQALIDLLRRRGLVEIRSKPKVLASDGREFEIRHVSDEQFFMRSSQKTGASTQTQLERVEYGTRIKGTPHVESGTNITVEMAVRTADPAPQAQPSDLPVVRTQAVESTMTVADNRYFSLLVEPDNKEAADPNGPSSLLVMFKPKIDEASSRPSDPVFAQGKPAVSHRPQVLLDVRVVEMEPGKRRNLGVEWGFPASQAGQAPADSDWTKALSIGHSPDQTSTNSLMAKLNELAATGQAKIVSNPQIVTLDGHPARLQSTQEEWSLMTGTNTPGGDSHSELQRIDSGTILDFTPYLGNGNDITLVVAVETSESMPQNQGDIDLPIVTRRQARNKVTVQDGGTVAMAGLVGNPGGRNGSSTKEIAIFVTAHLVPETGAARRIAKTISPPVQLAAGDVFHGRVLFTDGTPAVLQPAPRPGARTRIALVMKGRSTEVAQVDDDGYFVLRLENTQREALAAHREGVHLCIDLPTDRKYPWEGVAVFPFEKLAKTRQDAGTMTVRRTLPTITLPTELRQGSRLPDGWRLEYRPTPSTGRIEEILFNAEVVDSRLGLKVGEVPRDEEFVVYDPNGKEVERFRCQSMMAMYKTVQYTLIGRKGEGRHADDWRIVHGPYVLDMSRTGWYKLTIDLGATPETDPAAKRGSSP